MRIAGPATRPVEIRRRVKTASQAGLRYVNDQMPGIRRERSGESFRFRYPTGDIVTDEAVLKRIKALAIPPAWTEIWICPDPCGHLQATGRDARGRKQNRYHARWREVRDENKYSRMIAFGKALPKIRRQVERDLRANELPRQKVLAAVVRLLELSLIRVGNQEYARDNDSFGLTTMRDRHVSVKGENLRFSFRGKSGVRHEVGIRDRRLAKIVKSCQDLPGQELFQYKDGEGAQRIINSEDVNNYLRQITGSDFTAKDFRTWAGTLLAASALAEAERGRNKTQAKRNLKAAITAVAERLGNTPSVCRKCYIHPHVINAWMVGQVIDPCIKPSKECKGLRREEAAVLAFLRRQIRLEKQCERNPAAPFEATLRKFKKEKAARSNRTGQTQQFAA